MKKILNFILSLLEKKDPETEKLEDETLEFWSSLLKIQKTSVSAMSFFPYQDTDVKRAVLAIKTRNNKTILQNMLNVLYENLVEELSEMKVWQNYEPQILIAIPTSNKHKGFNQSEEIAKHFLKLNQNNDLVFLKNELVKIRITPIQHSLPREKRLKNLKNSMKIKNREKVIGKDILVVDDVTTTGATFEEAIRALKEAGARKVFCIALAH